MESLNNLETIREYLLGRISDEKTLEGIEELLFTDDDFCTKAEIVEDELINDYVFDNLQTNDKSGFEKTLENNSERRLKLQVTQQLKNKFAVKPVEEKIPVFDSIKAFFRSPVYAGSFAILLIAALIGTTFLLRSSNTDELAELRNIYLKERPIEPRISGFDYAPMNVTRGENKDDANKNKLELAKTKFLQEVVNNPNAENYHKLGVFYLTQQNYKDAIENLEKAVKADDKNAIFQNDLGSSYFQFAKDDKDNKLINLARANESFSKAIEINPNLLEALFNKALTLQELNLPRQAKESWELYLQKDSSSKWADEARKNLEKVARMQSSFKTKEQVLDDFLTAYRNGNEEFAWKINCQTKEMISGVWLPDQLSRRYLQARKNKDESTAKESIEALTYIGNLEHDRNADFFVRDLADYYANVGDEKIDDLLKAKGLLGEGYKLAPQSNFQQAQNKFEEAKSLFTKTGNDLEEKLAEYWIAFCESNIGNIQSSSKKLVALEIYTNESYYKWLELVIKTRLGENSFRNRDYSKSNSYRKNSLILADKLNDTLFRQKNASNSISFYSIFGDLQKSVNFLSQTFLPNLYFESRFQNWRNIGNTADILKSLNLNESSIEYAKEYLKIAQEKGEEESIIFDSNSQVTQIYSESGKFEEAFIFAKKGQEIIDKISDKNVRNLAQANSFVQIAHLKRLMNQCSQAITEYDDAIDIFSKLNEVKSQNYDLHKGKLICYSNLQSANNFIAELETVSDLIEDNRNQLLEEESRNSFFDREQSVANIATNYFLKQNDSRRAFEFSENSKARSLLDLLENKGFYDAKEKQIVFKESAKPFSVEKIQAQLSPNIQIIQYAVLEDKIAIWLISNNQFEVVTTLISADLLAQKVQNYLDLIKDKSPQTKQTSKELYDILLKPILAKPDKSKQICFVPDGILYHLPFASLVSSETEKYLIEDFALFYSPSATTSIILSEKAKTKPQTENLLAIGNPDFSRIDNSKLPSLPSAEKEVSDLAKFYEKPKVLINSEAVKSNVLSNFSKADIFHFAGHYVANPNSTLNSKLLLTQPTNSIDEFEGELRASEILQIKNPNLKLAVLSACETGIERYYKGEGAIGMARTFLAIGTPIVVASQWKVESESTLELMKAFHRNRKQRSLNTIEALRQAQIEMLAKKEFSEPYFWSAFSPVGGNVNF